MSNHNDNHHVLAMSNFEAVLEGQLSITKGEELILLDDSNAFWWLVRSKNGLRSGYVPAEMIETPLEKVARLNSQRNTYVAADDSRGFKPKTSPLRIQSKLSSSNKSKLDRKRSVQFSEKEHEIIDDFLGDETDNEEIEMRMGGSSSGAAAHDRVQARGPSSDPDPSSNNKKKKTIKVLPLAPSNPEKEIEPPMARIPSLDSLGSDSSLQEKLRSAVSKEDVRIPNLDEDDDMAHPQKESFFQRMMRRTNTPSPMSSSHPPDTQGSSGGVLTSLFKKSSWISKYSLRSRQGDAANSSLDLLRIYTRNWDSPATFKTLVIDESMTVRDLTFTAMKRLKVDETLYTADDFFITILRGDDHQILDDDLLITDVFRKQVQDGLTTPEYLQVFINRITKNNRESVMASKSSRASKTASKVGYVSKKLRQSQQRLSQRISLIGNLPTKPPLTPEPPLQEEDRAPTPLPKDTPKSSAPSLSSPSSKVKSTPEVESPKKTDIKNIFTSKPQDEKKEDDRWEAKKTDSIDQFLKDLESRRATQTLLNTTSSKLNAQEEVKMMKPAAKSSSYSPNPSLLNSKPAAPPAPLAALKKENDLVSKSRLSLLQSSLTDFMKAQRSSTYFEDQFGKEAAVENNPSTLTTADQDESLTSRFAPQVQPILTKPISKEELVESSPLVTASGQNPNGRLRTPDERLASERLLYSDLSAEILETLEVLQMMGKNLDGLFLQVGSVYGLRKEFNDSEALSVSAS